MKDFTIKSKHGVAWSLEFGSKVRIGAVNNIEATLKKAILTETESLYEFMDTNGVTVTINSNGDYRSAQGNWFPAELTFIME